MARKAKGDAALAPVSRRLTPPGVFLLRMTIFLTLIGFRGAIGSRVVHFDYAYTDGNALGRIDRFSVEVEF